MHEVLCHKYFKPGSLSKQWPHDPQQQAALRRSGRREAWMSSIPWTHRLILASALRETQLVPVHVRRVARRVATRVLR